MAWPNPPECDQVEPCPGWNASVSGTVTDPDGRPVEGATVEVDGVGMWEMPPPLTDRQGRYDYADYAMEPGTMTITATADGYEEATTRLTLHPGETRVVDLVLRPHARPTDAPSPASGLAGPREPVVRLPAARRPGRARVRR